MSKISLTIDSCFDDVRLVSSCVRSLAAGMFDDFQTYQIEVCLEEALTNCIKHSYQGMLGREVKATLQIDADRLAIDIADTGVGMDPDCFSCVLPEFEIDPSGDIPEGSRGLKIIKAWMDEAHYWNEGGVNHLLMVKRPSPKTVRQLDGL